VRRICELPRVFNLRLEIGDGALVEVGQSVGDVDDGALVVELFGQLLLLVFQLFAFLVGRVEVLEELVEVFREVRGFRVLLDLGDRLEWQEC
jgi:hypothetical protein